MTQTKIFRLAGILLIIGNLLGCASKATNSKVVCNQQITVPNSHKIYLFVSDKYNPDPKIAQAMRDNTAYALLRLDHEVKKVEDMAEVGSDGVLLQIDIIGNVRRGISKRIDIRYQVINNATGQVMLKEKDGRGSGFGYNKITVVLGRNIAKKYGDLRSCFEGRGKQPS